MPELSKRAKLQAFVALFLISCSLIFVQMGFTYLGGSERDEFMMLALVPVVATAFATGVRLGCLQGLLTGTVLSIHSMVQPYNMAEQFFMRPPMPIVSFALGGLIFGLLFKYLGGKDTVGRMRRVRVALSCVIGLLLFELIWSLLLTVDGVLYAGNTGIGDYAVELFVSSFSQLVVPITFLIKCLALFVFVEFEEYYIRQAMTSGKNARLHRIFGSRLFGLMLVTFAVISAVGFTLITYLDTLSAKEQMTQQLEAFSTWIVENDNHNDVVLAAADLFDGIMYEFEGALILADGEGTILASNNPAHPANTNLIEMYDLTTVYRINDMAQKGSMDMWLMPDLSVAWNANADGALPVIQGRGLGYACVRRVGDNYLIQARTADSIYDNRRVASTLMTLMAAASLVLAYVYASKLLRTTVEQPIQTANASLDKITNGDLDQRVQLDDCVEFVSLSTYINAAVTSLEEYAEETQRRIERDLATAKEIQESALPRTFPPFPGVDAFDVYASMVAAKYVGGDFFDLFLVDDHKLGFLIADVSGKGIPAALFMMRAKTHMATSMQSGCDLVQAVTDTNVRLCEDNDACMFVTVWAAVLDWETGELTYVNAGHDIPLLRHDGQWTWFEDIGGPFLGAMDFSTYECATVTLDHGDALYLYTDGVTEAMNPAKELFGKERMVAFLQKNADLHPRELDDAIRQELATWADGAEQSDDITMLALEYR